MNAQDNAPFPPANIVNDEGGVVIIRGEVSYTNPFFTSGVSFPLIILEDQSGFVHRDRGFVFPLESQTLGQITSDFYTSPFNYSLALPIEPQGTYNDVDNDNEADTGVMVFAIAYWHNVWGDPFLDVRDQNGGGWSGAYASTRSSNDPEQRSEIVGGSFLIYAPDDQQGFPSGFGDDGLLFTEDDPIVTVPQGYIIVNMDTIPFTFDRAREQSINLIEPDSAALVDFSNQGFSTAFDSMIAKFRTDYAFTEYKNIDWDALETEFRPRFLQAEQQNDDYAYLTALREFIWRIPDGHVNLSPFDPFLDEFTQSVAQGIGMGIRETDDMRVLVTSLVDDGPASLAGISLRAEIRAINGIPINDFIGQAEPWTQPFSTDHNRRLEQLIYALRFDQNTSDVSITFRNPGQNGFTTREIPTEREFDTLFSNPLNEPELDGLELPVEFHLVDDTTAYAAIYSFLDDDALAIQLWERMIQQMHERDIDNLIIDMRQNGGGDPFLADQMAAYFFQEELIIGSRGTYSEQIDGFFFDPDLTRRFYLPSEDLRYDGNVAVLIGPSCASACERFAYDMTLQDRAAIIGQYPTAGLGGGVEDFLMPLGITVRITVTRSVDFDGNIHIEGLGIPPTIRVPVNEITLFEFEDPVMAYGLAYLQDRPPSLDGGNIAIGDVVQGQFFPGLRQRYTLVIEGGKPLDIFLGDESGDLTTVVRFYDLDGNLLLSNEDSLNRNSGNSLLSGIGSDQTFTVILEVGTFEDQLEGRFTLSISESEFEVPNN
ncbi:MAG: S41 family peptidase [Aggregatilineales bacterium]